MAVDVPRWLTHAVLLVTLVTLPAISGLLGGRTHPETSFASVLAAAPTIRTASLTASRGYILKPAGSPMLAPPARPRPVVYTVKQGDVLGAIAEQYGLRIDTLRQTNNIADVDALQIDQQVLIPPTNGVMVRVADGDTVATLAARFHEDPQTIIDYNLVRDPNHLTVGDMLMLPDGTGLTTAQASTTDGSAPGGASTGRSQATAAPGSISYGHSSYNHFPWGQCTYWVASRRDIPWNGNAWQWFGAAQSYGYATGRTPRVGAMMVTWESRYYGHVALVEAVYDDGSWLVSEMNYRGLGVVDRRRISYGQVPLIGFIY
ncbi:MAG: LysM peptidoglycan-binding domain-containing protein [Candidatus Dormibacteria bacterium]